MLSGAHQCVGIRTCLGASEPEAQLLAAQRKGQRAKHAVHGARAARAAGSQALLARPCTSCRWTTSGPSCCPPAWSCAWSRAPPRASEGERQGGARVDRLTLCLREAERGAVLVEGEVLLLLR